MRPTGGEWAAPSEFTAHFSRRPFSSRSRGIEGLPVFRYNVRRSAEIAFSPAWVSAFDPLAVDASASHTTECRDLGLQVSLSSFLR